MPTQKDLKLLRSMIFASAPLDGTRKVSNPTSDHDALESDPYFVANIGGVDDLPGQSHALMDTWIRIASECTPEMLEDLFGPPPEGRLEDWMNGSLQHLKLDTRFVSPVFNGPNRWAETMRRVADVVKTQSPEEAARIIALELTMPGWSTSHKNPYGSTEQQRYNTMCMLYLYARLAQEHPDEFHAAWHGPTNSLLTSMESKIDWLEDNTGDNTILFVQEATRGLAIRLEECRMEVVHHSDMSRPFCLLAFPPGTEVQNISTGPRCACARLGDQTLVSFHSGYTGGPSDDEMKAMCTELEESGTEFVVGGDFNYGKAPDPMEYRKDVESCFGDPIYMSPPIATRKPDAMSIWDPQGKRTPK